MRDKALQKVCESQMVPEIEFLFYRQGGLATKEEFGKGGIGGIACFVVAKGFNLNVVAVVET